MLSQKPPSLTFTKVLCPQSIADSLGGRLPPKGSKVGLLGGSFNPAHKAHCQISKEALVHLGLDEVWWLVSPQNPLKDTKGMAPLAERVNSALSIPKHPKVRVTTIESQVRSVYTADTLSRLKQIFPWVDFTWLMGADNLSQIPLWRDWQDIFNTVKVAVFARPGYSLQAANSKAARRFRNVRVSEKLARSLSTRVAPAWTIIHGQQLDISSTAIRNGKRKD
ncbi:nicotinate-nucleotide adenylyltransferase [Kiloniella litopenaei]|uniref:nicotinate-nucleotide adenylyltransferase n=1 Tax=Kiloniella litopenaei TaxID=1549748 RepID=UPI0009E1DA7E|nr:nicotinate-nucleotide adenylyltransferase [Kiloniella litopenaei]